jgi:hypothetical protein
MDGIVLFSMFGLGFALPAAIGIFAAIMSIVALAGCVEYKLLERSMEKGRKEFREEFGYEMGESPWS